MGFMSQLSNVINAGVFESSKLYPNDCHQYPVVCWMQKKSVGMPSIGLKKIRLSPFNFITKFYFTFFKSYFENFHLCGSGRIITIPHLDFTPCFEFSKFLGLCSVYVIELTFFTTSQIQWLTVVSLPLGFFR